jgi:drug/metabolite transporter (DMT)-like permease
MKEPDMGSGVAGLGASTAGLVLTAAVLHASWNAVAHGIKDKLVSFTLIGIGGGVASVPLLLLADPPSARCLPYLIASVGLHTVYNVALMTSFRLGDFGQVYPLARGTSPLVVTVLAAAFVGEMPAPAQWLGVLAVSVGLCSLVFVGGRPSRAELPAIGAALVTGLAIASYTTVDGIGVRRSGSPGGYTGWLTLAECVVIPLYVVAFRRDVLRGIGRAWLPGTVGGVLSVVAYGLVLWAQTRGALAQVAALRETSIIFGALIATFFFHERFGKVRVIAAGCVVTGILLLDLG